MPSEPFHAVVVAAGSGTRAGFIKQWASLAGKPVARWSVEALLSAGAQSVILVHPAGQDEQARRATETLPRVKLVAGGSTRAESVRRGLEAASDAQGIVLIHDAARPLLPARIIEDILQALADADGAVPALPIDDSLRRGSDGVLSDSLERAGLWRMQTPQGFRVDPLRNAIKAWPAEETATDEAVMVQRNGGKVSIVPGDTRLHKITRMEDMAVINASIVRQVRVGQGFDVHRWGPGDSVWLCGVRIEHDQTLIGHSDADAGLHALTDALFGALGDGDIGDHFPPTDPQWKGASSDRFLIHALERLKGRGGRLINADLTLICERPKVKPHRAAMRERLAELLGVTLDAVSVKATTTEGLGFTGRGEGLAAQAIVSIELPTPLD